MVEQKLPKLTTRVRFPSPAPSLHIVLLEYAPQVCWRAYALLWEVAVSPPSDTKEKAQPKLRFSEFCQTLAGRT
jgi:hypothetical protein